MKNKKKLLVGLKPLTAFFLSLAVTIVCVVTLFSIPVNATMGNVTTTAPAQTTAVTTTQPNTTAEQDNTASDNDGSDPNILSLLIRMTTTAHWN